MNYFFKFLVPQLLEYFNQDKETVKEFIPKVITQKYGNVLLEYHSSNKEMEEQDEIIKQ